MGVKQVLQLRDLDVTGPTGDAMTITENMFGARYNAWRNFDNFSEQIEDASFGMIIWPDGYLSEVNNGVYGLQHEGLFDPDAGGNRPELSELFSFAAANNMAVSIILPTRPYQDDPDALKADALSFLDDVYSGKFGPLPDKLIFEIGNEFDAVFEGNDMQQATDYIEVVNAYAEVIASVENRYEVSPDQVKYSIQLGKTDEINEAMLELVSDDALLMTDLLTHHRFPFFANGADNHVETTQQGVDDWSDAIDDAGGDAPNLYLSAYNTASLTRKEAEAKFLDDYPDQEVDLEGRTNLEFEQFYQDQLDVRDHGLEHGKNLLQIFSEYQPIGVEAAGTYGWDTIHAARSSLNGTDGEPYVFAGGAAQDMMAESLIGTHTLDWYQQNDHRTDDEVSLFGFDSADKLVIFVTAPDFDGESLTTSLAMDGLGETVAVWGESLTAETPENWNELFDVPVTPGVDQSPEAETYAVATREEFTPDVRGDDIQITFTQPNEVVRLTFARTEEGRDEIETWHDGTPAELDGVVPIGPNPTPIDPGEDPDADEPQEDADGGDDGGGGFPVEALLLGLLLPLLMGLG